MVTSVGLSECVNRTAGSSPWLLHVNGHRYSEDELFKSGRLEFEESMVSEPSACRNLRADANCGWTLMKNMAGLQLSSFQAYINASVKKHKCGQESFKVYEESDTFLLGPDAKIHFTDTHLTIPNGGLDQERNSAQLCRVQLSSHIMGMGLG